MHGSFSYFYCPNVHNISYFSYSLSFLACLPKELPPVVQTMFSDLADKEHYHKVFAMSELAIGLAAVVTIVVMGSFA